MFPYDWIFGAANVVSKVGKAVYDFVYGVVAAIVGWVTSAIVSIITTLVTLAQQIAEVFSRLVNLALNVAWTIAMGIAHAVQQLMTWVGGLIDKIWGYLNGLLAWISSLIVMLEVKIFQVFQDVLRWVNENVIQPIWAELRDFKGWVTHWITFLAMYISHPEMLVDLIGAALWRLWTQYAVRYGSVLARWMLRSMMGMAGELFDLLEHVLTSVL